MIESKKQTAARSRSQSPKSRSKSPKRSSSVKFKSKKSQRKETRAVITKHLRTIGPVIKRLGLLSKQMEGIKLGYFDSKDKDNKTDPKAIQNEMDLLNKEIEMARDAIAAGLGDKPIKIRLSCGFVITTTVTSGVTNTVNIAGSGTAQLDPSQCSEWTTCAALFDAYRCHGGRAVFNYNNPIGSGAITSDSLPVIGYEIDNVAATSSLALTQKSQHKILDASLTSGGGVSTVPASCVRHDFKWHLLPGIVLGSGDPGSGEWIATAGPSRVGFLQFYHLGTVITATNQGAGIIYFDLQFRARI